MEPINHCPATFVFFHIGNDISMPKMLVDSINLTNPGADIIQCTDLTTPLVPGITKKLRISGNPNEIMSFRINAFNKAKLLNPAIYLDTDMLVIKKININQLLGKSFALMCKRNYTLEGAFIGNQRGLTFHEYDKKPLGEVFPFVACATITKDYKFWSLLSDEILTLDSRFQKWYGDQEAMKNVYFKLKNQLNFGYLNESEFGYLPGEKMSPEPVKIIHFKGNKKELMTQTYNKLMKS